MKFSQIRESGLFNVAKYLFLLFKKSADDMLDHNGIEYAGNLAFNFILSLFPFLVFLMALTGFIGETEIGIKLVDSLLQVMPDYASKALSPIIKEIISGPPEKILTISIFGAIWTASSVVDGFHSILNLAYRARKKHFFLLRRLFSILQFLIISIILIIIIFVLIILPAIWNKIEYISQFIALDIPRYEVFEFAGFLSSIIVFVALFLFVAACYILLPDTKIKAKSAFYGALITVIGWVIVGRAFSFYMKYFFERVDVIYSSLGGIIISMIFFYIINIVFIFGAEFGYNIVHFEIKEDGDNDSKNN